MGSKSKAYGIDLVIILQFSGLLILVEAADIPKDVKRIFVAICLLYWTSEIELDHFFFFFWIFGRPDKIQPIQRKHCAWHLAGTSPQIGALQGLVWSKQNPGLKTTAKYGL